MDLPSLMDEFRAEAGDHLRKLEAQLLILERAPANPQPIREMFLSAHTIKGGAAMVGLDKVRALAHELENVLAELRDGRGVMDPGTADILLRTLDGLGLMIRGPEPTVAVPDSVNQELIAALRGCLKSTGPAPSEVVSTPMVAAGPRALLVEGSATVRLLEEMLLADAGFIVDAVGDGAEAIDRVASTTYDLLVTGAQTPTLAGLDLIAAIRQVPSGRDLPVIVMSTDEHPEDRRRAVALGVNHYVPRGSLTQQLLIDMARQIPRRIG